MILRERPVPETILYNEAALKRLPPLSDLRPKIEESLLKARAGYSGECRVDRLLSIIDSKDTYIIHDLCLQTGSTYIQIDTLILTKYLALILEIKNISGRIKISPEFDQIERTINGEITAFPSPIAQCKKYKIHLLVKENEAAQPSHRVFGCFYKPLVNTFSISPRYRSSS